MLEYRGTWTAFHGPCEIIEPGDVDYIPALYRQGKFQIRLLSGDTLQKVRPKSIFIV
jgi:hypothetical protein